MPDQRTDFKRYQYGAAAAYLASTEDGGRYAPGALEVLAGAKGLNLGEDAEGFIRGTQASEDGVTTAIAVYASKFEEKRGEYKPSELVDWYGSALGGLESGDRDKIVGALNRHDETIKSIREKYAKAKYMTDKKAPKGLFSNDQIAEAKETIARYKDVMDVMQTLDRYSYESLRPDAVDTTRMQELKNLASKL
jgi:hypothetical protein